MAPQREPLPALTSLRFFAALAVVLHHYLPTFWLAYERVPLLKLLAGQGFAGVSLFFVLSGFILTYTYHERLRNGLNAGNVWDFYAARVARVYPLFLLSWVMVLPWTTPAPGAPPLRQIAPYTLSLTHALVPDRAVYFAFNGPSWSVSTEAAFYLCFPLLFWLSLRCGLPGRPRRALAVGGALLAAWWLWSGLWLRHPLYHWHCYICPLGRLFDFSVGIALGWAFLASRNRAPSRRHAVLRELAAVGLVLVAVAASPLVAEGWTLGPYYTPPMAYLIYVLACGQGPIARCLRGDGWQVLGRSSYALYLVHMPVMIGFMHTRVHWGATGPVSWRSGLWVLGACVALSVLLHYGVEEPMRLRVRRWLRWDGLGLAAPRLSRAWRRSRLAITRLLRLRSVR